MQRSPTYPPIRLGIECLYVREDQPVSSVDLMTRDPRHAADLQWNFGIQPFRFTRRSETLYAFARVPAAGARAWMEDRGLAFECARAVSTSGTCRPGCKAAVKLVVLRHALVWDNHGCMPLRPDAAFLPQLERYRAAGVDVVSLNVSYGDMPWTQVLEILSFMRRWLAGQPDRYRLIASAADAQRCGADGRLGVMFDVEGMDPAVDRPSLVQTFYELGVRWMLIAYNKNNAAGGGCLDDDRGLTAAGRGLIAEMARVGMVLCLSHAGARTAAEALDLAEGPVIFSHSNARAVTPHPRNVSDDLMRRCAAKGGVIGLNGIGLFLGGSDLIAAFVRHLQHVLAVVGPEHVALALDYVFDPAETEAFVRAHPELFPPNTDDVRAATQMLAPEALPLLVDAMSDLGLADRDIRGFLGENWLRVARQVWK